MKKKYLFAFPIICILIALMMLMSLAIFKRGGDDAFTDASKKAQTQQVYNFLILGRDDAASLTDVIILVSLNTESGDATFMQIPRDTYFSYTDSSYKKINGAAKMLGTEGFANMLSKELGIGIDYYLSIGLSGFAKVIDALGGIEMNVPFDMDYDDPSQNLSIHLKKGNQVLNGERAIAYLRYRSGYVTGDIGRVNAQKIFLDAFGKKVREVKNPITVYRLIKLLLECSETNISEKTLVSLSGASSKASGGKASYLTAPGEAVQSDVSGAWYYVLSRPAVSSVLEELFGLENAEKYFDKDNKFVDKNVKSFYDIYDKYCEIKIYSADEIENNMININ